MDFTPNRTQGSLIGAAFMLLLIGAAVAGLSQLTASRVTAWIIIWVLLPLVSLPLAILVGYRLYGLWTAEYRIDREGFYLRWGMAREQIPLGSVSSVVPLQELNSPPRPRPGWWWPGCVTAKAAGGADGGTEFFAGGGLAAGVLLTADNLQLVITPADPAQFVKSFTDATRLGSLHPIGTLSERPDFVFDDVWRDQWARWLILAGALLPLGLLAFVGWRAAGLPGSVPFGFDAFGRPGPPAPPGRLLLLPFMAGALWLIDLALGAWLYRIESDRVMAYTVWTSSLVGGLLLWGAAFHLISRA